MIGHAVLNIESMTMLVRVKFLLISACKKLVMDGYPLRLSGSGRISTIRQNLPPAGFHVSRRIAVLITSDLVFDFSEIQTSFVKFEFVL